MMKRTELSLMARHKYRSSSFADQYNLWDLANYDSKWLLDIIDLRLTASRPPLY